MPKNKTTNKVSSTIATPNPTEGINELANKLLNKISPATDFIKANPLKSVGYGATGAINLAGLFDNDKIGGQLVGAGLGGLATKLLNKSPAGIVLGAMTGGSLGSLFDMLRAKEDSYDQQYYNMY